MTSGHVASAEPRACDRLYGEPTLGAGVTTRWSGSALPGTPPGYILEGGGFVLGRAAFGWRMGECANDQSAVGWRLGAAFVYATGDLGRSTPLGVGLEGELSVSVSRDVRLGVRAGIDHHMFGEDAQSRGTTVMPMLGIRARFRDIAAAGVDGVYVHYDSSLWGRETGGGVIATASLGGRAGLVGALATGSIILLGFVVGVVESAGG
jgi:hypothetical protein